MKGDVVYQEFPQWREHPVKLTPEQAALIARGPAVILVAPYVAATYEAALNFQGRDWRRIKREMRKAGKRYRRKRGEDS